MNDVNGQLRTSHATSMRMRSIQYWRCKHFCRTAHSPAHTDHDLIVSTCVVQHTMRSGCLLTDPVVLRRRPRFAAAALHLITRNDAALLLPSLSCRNARICLTRPYCGADCTLNFKLGLCRSQGPNKFALGLVGAFAAAQLAIIPAGQCCYLHCSDNSCAAAFDCLAVLPSLA